MRGLALLRPLLLEHAYGLIVDGAVIHQKSPQKWQATVISALQGRDGLVVESGSGKVFCLQARDFRIGITGVCQVELMDGFIEIALGDGCFVKLVMEKPGRQTIGIVRIVQ